MFDHVGVVTRDLEAGGRFYEAVLAHLGLTRLEAHGRGDGTGWLVFGTGATAAPFFVLAAGRPTFWDMEHEAARSPVHLAFRAPSQEAVDAFHAEGLRLGARDNGSPGVRRPPYYCAFLIDPDGNNLGPRREQPRGRIVPRLRGRLGRSAIIDPAT